MKRTAFFALFWILVLLAGCSSNSAGSAGDMQPPAEAAPGLSTEAAAGEETAADSHSVSMSSDPGRKLIRTVWLTAETENFSGLMEQVSSHTTQLGGYVESQEADYGNASDQAQARRADLTIRIPAEQLQTFVGRISELSHILRSRETAEDITLTYADTESRMAALETERDRLMALMEQAETMEDLLAVESRLTEVRYQLESTGSQLKLYDNLVSYSTVYFRENLSSLGSGLASLLVFLAAGTPYWVPLALLALLLFLLVRRLRKRAKAGSPPPDPPHDVSQN